MSRASFRLVGKKKLTAVRYPEGSRDEATGEWIQPEPIQFEVVGNIQPVSGAEKQFLSESVRSKVVMAFLSNDELRTTEEYGQSKADRIIYKGFEYEVHQVQSFEMGVVDHHEYTIVRAEQSAGL